MNEIDYELEVTRALRMLERAETIQYFVTFWQAVGKIPIPGGVPAPEVIKPWYSGLEHLL